MQFNHQIPAPVFPSSSWARHKAELPLPANYFPPIQIGDNYRLIATGARTIIIIDGVFHNTTPIWQHELDDSIGNDIIDSDDEVILLYADEELGYQAISGPLVVLEQACVPQGTGGFEQ